MSTVTISRQLGILLVDGVNNPQRKTDCSLPILLLLIWRPSSGVWKTEENGASKRQYQQESKPPLLALMSWPAIFLFQFLQFVLLLLLHHSGKLAIPHDYMLLLLQILHLFLIKSLQRQGGLIVSEDIRVFFWWARYRNICLSFLRRAYLLFFWNEFVAIYFWPVSKKFTPPAIMRSYPWKVNTFQYIGLCHWPCRWCTM